MGQPIVAILRNDKCYILSTTGHELRSFGQNVVEVQMTGGDGVVIRQKNGKSYLYNGQTGQIMKVL
jgi:c-di-AMP phosphodiesterase-like protein